MITVHLTQEEYDSISAIASAVLQAQQTLCDGLTEANRPQQPLDVDTLLKAYENAAIVLVRKSLAAGRVLMQFKPQ